MLVVGSINADLVTRVARLPSAGETVLGTSFEILAGGKGANQAVAAQRSGGAQVSLVGAVGGDAFGARLRQEIEAAGVDTAGIALVPDRATGTAQILVDAQGRNQIAVAPGANDDVVAPAAIDADLVILQLEIPDDVNDAVIESASRANAIVVLNAAPARPLTQTMRAELGWLVVNESEAAQLAAVSVANAEQARRAAAALRRAGQGVIVTLGAAGAVLVADGSALHQAAPIVEAIDTVAAGDAFAGTFAAALARGDGIEDALALASCAGALACTRRGAQASLPPAAEVEDLRRSLAPATRLAP